MEKQLEFAEKWLESTDQTTQAMVNLLMDKSYIQALKDANDFLLENTNLRVKELDKMFIYLEK